MGKKNDEYRKNIMNQNDKLKALKNELGNQNNLENNNKAVNIMG